MTLLAHLLVEPDITLWGLSSRERLGRMLTRAGITGLVDDLGDVPADDAVLLIRADWLYDARVLKGLIDSPCSVLTAGDDLAAVAANVPRAKAVETRDYLAGIAASALPDGLKTVDPNSIVSAGQTTLLKREDPYVLSITRAKRGDLEKRLFDGSYKGITDLVTKWAWPTPARWVTHVCAAAGISPNQVTGVSWLLALLTTYLFFQGHFAWGLVAGWIMTFLDTVDGKLARVTVSYTQFGNLFDHILDLVHPPFWYLAWAVGLTHSGIETPGLSLNTTAWLVFGGYIFGRVAEGLFSGVIANFSIFAWRPVDSYSRLVTARRNPCLIMLTLGIVGGRPDAGLLAVVLWTLISTVFLWLRLGTAWYEKVKLGPLEPWISAGDACKTSLAYRWFAR